MEEKICENSCHCEEKNSCKGECECEQEKDKEEKKEKKNKKEEKNALKEALEKIKEQEQEILKGKADFINYRKRLEEEKDRLFKYCNEDLIKEMLVVVDNFERAIALDDENLEDELSNFLKGFKMIYCNLVQILENYGVKAIDGSNKPFDPAYHQAVLTEHVEDKEPGMVLEVLQKGYLLKDRVIRPAMVRVSE